MSKKWLQGNNESNLLNKKDKINNKSNNSVLNWNKNVKNLTRVVHICKTRFTNNSKQPFVNKKRKHKLASKMSSFISNWNTCCRFTSVC